MMVKQRMAGRLASALLILVGCGLVAAGQTAPLNADVNCVEGDWIEPAECTAAHVDLAPQDRVGGLSGGCGFTGGICQAQGAACDAMPKFNNAVKGKCQAYIGGSDTYRCSDDFFKTAITLTKIVGGCDSVNGDCACRYSPAMPPETMNVEVCNCKQEAV